MNENLEALNTEQQNSNTQDIDLLSTIEIVEKINDEDKKIASIVEEQIPAIAALIDAAIVSLKKGGRIIYLGAGTSGRLGILDASECPPTYGVDPQLIQGLIAGGQDAMFQAREGAEDSKELAVRDLQIRNLSSNDFVIGLAASGRTPYVIGALEYANEIGASTGSIACVSNARISSVATYPIEVVTGPEVVTGSTRMKAGTAEKMVLNMISTTAMIKMGKVYKNLMVDVKASNHKLVMRAIRMIQNVLLVDFDTAQDLFEKSNRNVKRAIAMYYLECDCDEAQEKLDQADGMLSAAIQESKLRG